MYTLTLWANLHPAAAMELPPSYEEATMEEDSFDGRIGVGSKFCRQVFLKLDASNPGSHGKIRFSVVGG